MENNYFNNMNICKSYKLHPIDGINRQKSFYGKAIVHVYNDGTKLLQSYNTVVACITPDGAKFKCWNGYSKTTLEHVKAFFEINTTKKEWDNAFIYDIFTGEIKHTNIDEQYHVYYSNGFCKFKSQARFNGDGDEQILLDHLNNRGFGFGFAWIE